MPALTGVPILDAFVWLGAIALAAAGAFGAIMKFMSIFKPTPYGRRSEDVSDLKDLVVKNRERVGICETKIGGIEDKIDDLKESAETQRREQRENTQEVFRRLDNLTQIVVSNGRQH